MQAKHIQVLRKIVQLLALGFFLYLFIFATFMNPHPGLSEIFYRFDPLVALTAMLAGRVFIGGFALAGITVVLTLLFGRVWCGWVCPMGTTLDLIKPRRRLAKDTPIPPSENWRKVKYILLIFILAAAVLGNQSLIFLDPVTLLNRTLSNAIWPAFSAGIYTAEKFLYRFDFLWDALDKIHQAVIYPVFRDTQSVYPLAVPIFLLFAGILALNWWAPRFWCRYLCPLGGLLGWLSRFSLFRRQVDERCISCSACSRRCPTATIKAEEAYTSDPAECTICYDCAPICPTSSITFPSQLKRWKPAPAQPSDPSRREALRTMGVALAWAAVTQVEPIELRKPANLVRPPGSDLVDFEELCIRCNECVRVCPTQGLQASFLEAGWRNVFTPRLVPRVGYCSYNCNACGEVCPSGAIPPLSMEVKQNTPIGLARVDRDRCLPWSYNIDCIVCEEACPIANKAIKLDELETTNALGEKVVMKRPYVVKELCIGCGMCEYQCPMGGEAAIRVFTYTEAGGYFGPGSG